MNSYADMLRAVEHRDVMAWLKARGWVLHHHDPDRLAVYVKGSASDVDGLEVLLPLDTSFRDYTRRMDELVETLAVDRDCSKLELMSQLREAPYDVVRLRATGAAVGAGRVSVETGARLFQNARDLLLAAAYSAHTPSMDHPRRKPEQVTGFLERAKFAAPEAGSFIVKVCAPIPPDLTSGVDGAEDLGSAPFERRTTWTLARAVHAAKRAADAALVEGRDAPFLGHTEEGVSANLCGALAGLVEHGEDAALEVALSWASVRPAPRGVPERVRIARELAPALREGERALRAHARRERRPEFELVGHVVALESARLEHGGSAVIEGAIDGRPRRVQVALGAAEYGLALQAHGRGRMLRCVGELKRTPKGRQLDHPTRVALVEPGEA